MRAITGVNEDLSVCKRALISSFLLEYSRELFVIIVSDYNNMEMII